MKNTSDATAPFAAANGSALDPTNEQIVMGYEAMRICLGRPTRDHNPIDVIRWMEKQRLANQDSTIPVKCPVRHAGVAKGMKCPGCGEVPNPLSEMIISAPSGEDLQPTKEEQEHFERLIRWQEESARSPIRLGGTQNVPGEPLPPGQKP